jgi:Aerotolerance regulator N-terminal
MFELFLNPWAMAAGTVLISSPIIIHLINRMRFRRIRWAAMEFLLKSQKKNRRRVIIEQIILLLLRILLVLLAAFLLARFLGALAGPQQNTVHVIILDDTPSMADFERVDGKQTDAFAQAKRVIGEEIAQFASQATTPQSLVLVRLSDLDAPRKWERLNSSTVDEIKAYLADLEPSNLHIDAIKGLQAAQTIFEQSKEERRLLHVVSDLRYNDWTGAPADALRQAMEQFRAVKVDVHFIDSAFPVRSDTQKSVLYHDNMAIVDFQPETRVAARFMQVEFSVAVANYSSSERKNVRVTVRVKGQERAEGSFNIPSVPAGSITTGTFSVAFDQLGQNPVSVNLENEETGLLVDNVRHAVVEVREKVPLLIIEGDLKSKGTQDSDGYFLQSLFSESTRGFDVVTRTPIDLEKLPLEQYPSIFVLNVARLSDKATQALEKYVRGGGGVVFFMGSEIKPDYYNKLYADGKGLFPAPMADKPTEAPSASEREERRFGSLTPKIYPRNESHAIFTRIYRDEKTRTQSRENNKHLVFAAIDRYFPVPRTRWNVKPGEVDELMTLPNSRQIVDYADETNNILSKLPTEDPQNAKFRARLEEHRRTIKSVLLNGGELYKLVGPLDALLNESGPADDPSKPNLQEFWQAREQADLRERLSKLLETVRYGDPFLIGKNLGKGRVLAYMSSANAAWNDLPNGIARPYFVMLLVEMQKFLASGAAEVNLTLGSPLDIELDATRYESKARRFFPPKIDVSKGLPNKYAPIDAGEQTGDVKDNKLTFRFNEARNPGVFEFVLTRKDAGDADKPMGGAAPPKAADPDKGRQETIAYAFNLDGLAESNLKRADRDDLSAVAGANVQLHKPGDGAYENLLKLKKSDFSESPWLYLIFLIVLIAEQAMAVRLSFHAAAAVQ